MQRTGMLLLALVVGALGHAVLTGVSRDEDSGSDPSQGGFRGEARLERELASERALNVELRHQLNVRLAELATCTSGDGDGECRCEPPAQCGAATPVAAAPNGTRLESSEQRSAYVREHLEEKLATAFEPGDMDEATRAEVLDLLLEIRELHAEGEGAPLDDPAVSASRDALVGAQERLTELTGLGVGELLRTLDAGSPGRSLRPEEGGAELEGEERKRFADEASRMLGVTQPGSVEVLRDGEWVEE